MPQEICVFGIETIVVDLRSLAGKLRERSWLPRSSNSDEEEHVG